MHCLDLVHSKNDPQLSEKFKSHKIFKIVVNQIEYLRVEQRFVIK